MLEGSGALIAARQTAYRQNLHARIGEYIAFFLHFLDLFVLVSFSSSFFFIIFFSPSFFSHHFFLFFIFLIFVGLHFLYSLVIFSSFSILVRDFLFFLLCQIVWWRLPCPSGCLQSTSTIMKLSLSPFCH